MATTINFLGHLLGQLGKQPVDPLRQGPRPQRVEAPEDPTDAQSGLFRDLLNQLRLRTINPDPNEGRRQADQQQYDVIRQIAGLEQPIGAMREDAVSSLMNSGIAQADEQYGQAGSRLRSILAGRGLTGSSGDAINKGRLASGQEQARNEAARAAQGFRDETEAQSTSMLTRRAQDALTALEPNARSTGNQAFQAGVEGLVNAGQAQQEYSGLMNRLNMEYRNALSQVIGGGLQNAVGGFANYGFDRANQINSDANVERQRRILGFDGGSRSPQATFTPLR